MKKTIEQRQAYHDRKAKELDQITDAHKYTRRLTRVMKYHRLISELIATEVKKTLKGDVEEMTERNVEIISGLDKANLSDGVFELDRVLGGIELNSATIESIDIELGKIAVDVDNTGTDLQSMGLMLHDIRHQVRLISDLLHYVHKDLKANVERLEDVQESLSTEVRKLHSTESKKISHPLAGMKTMSAEREREIAMAQNTKSFISEFGREPKDYEEVQNWVSELVEKLKIDTKKA